MFYRLVFLLLLFGCAWSEQATGRRQLQTELGVVSVPADSVWETRMMPYGTLYIGKRPTLPPQIYMVTLKNSGTTLLWDTKRAMDEMAADYCETLASTFQTTYSGLQNRLTDRGSQFSCNLADGGKVFGRIYLGRHRTVILTGIDCSKGEFSEYVQTFAPNPLTFLLPSSQFDSSARIGFGVALLGVIVNLVLALAALVYFSEEPRKGSAWIARWFVIVLAVEALVPTVFAARFVPDRDLLAVLAQAVVEHLVIVAAPPMLLLSWLGQLWQKRLDKRKEPG